jgi:hypothetical protein
VVKRFIDLSSEGCRSNDLLMDRSCFSSCDRLRAETPPSDSRIIARRCCLSGQFIKHLGFRLLELNGRVLQDTVLNIHQALSKVENLDENAPLAWHQSYNDTATAGSVEMLRVSVSTTVQPHLPTVIHLPSVESIHISHESNYIPQPRVGRARHLPPRTGPARSLGPVHQEHRQC